MAARYLSKVAIGAIAVYLALGLTIALFHPADVDAAAPGTASINAPTSTNVVLPPHTFAFDQAPLNSFSTITIPATPTGPAVLETAVVTVTEYVTVPAPLPTSITGLFEEYPCTTTATFMGMTCFWITIIWLLLTFLIRCRLKIAARVEKKQKEEARQKLMDLEKAPELSEASVNGHAPNRTKTVSQKEFDQRLGQSSRQR